MMPKPLLEVTDLEVEFARPDAVVRAAERISFHVEEGEVVGLVGESGCGKSATALALLGLVPHPGRIAGGRVELEGADILSLSEKEVRRLRGAGIAYVPQEPGLSLSPVLTLGDQFVDVARAHRKLSRAEARAEAAKAFERVGISDPERRVGEYPHQYSGGMKQRALIALALAAEPRVLVADEPTTAIDVTLQAGILDLFRRLVDDGSLGGLLLITHDLGVVAASCDRVLVMYAGRIVEEAPVEELFARPAHPYTRALVASLPDPRHPRGALPTVPGQVPDLADLPEGCAFHPRCTFAKSECRVAPPPLVVLDGGRRSACVLERLP